MPGDGTDTPEMGGGLTPKDQLLLAKAFIWDKLRPGLTAEITRLGPDDGLRFDPGVEAAGVELHGACESIDATHNLVSAFEPRKAAMLDATCTFAQGLPAALAQAVARQRIGEEQLPEARRGTLREALAKRFGEDAGSVQVLAVFADVPPEAVQSVKIAADYSSATFVPAAAETGEELRPGFYLAVVQSKSDKTDKFLIRLD